MSLPSSSFFRAAVSWAEQLLALAVLVGLAAFFVASVPTLVGQDWGQLETVYDLIYRVLVLVIGLELIRTLVTHELRAILELLAFVLARKLLKPNLDALDIFLCTVAFIGLLAAGRYLLPATPTPETPANPAPESPFRSAV